jgi:hypothetical protein
MFFFASSRCSAGDPVSLGPEAVDKPLVRRDGLNAIVSLGDSLAECVERAYLVTRLPTVMKREFCRDGREQNLYGTKRARQSRTKNGS